ncbi:MAG: nuclear transport factor 2 family protein [Acidobacteria bacterium]|nr:nuclear transport factor 2 family protein [Acidobacteriota bacterium]MBK8813947.1 nuclear transport factor 2 family protein [Acidobacteriota bacterium]
MKKLIVLFVLIGIGGLSFGYKAFADEKEKVRVPLESYIKGHATGNPDFIRAAFHKDARINAFRDGKLLNLSAEEFAVRFNGKAADDEAKRKRSIDTIEISGNSAIARITLDYPAVKFTDYMSLLKIDGEWKIINKTFYAEPKEAGK